MIVRDGGGPQDRRGSWIRTFLSPPARVPLSARPTAGATGDPWSRELVRKAPPGDYLSRVAVRKRPEGGYLLQRTRAQIGFAHALSGISLAYAALLGEGLKPARFPPPTSFCKLVKAHQQRLNSLCIQRGLVRPSEPQRLAARRFSVSEGLLSLSERTSPD